MRVTLAQSCALVWLVQVFGLDGTAPCKADDDREFLVVGYLPEYRIKAFDPEHAAPLTDIVLFSVEPRSDGSLDTSRLDPWMGEPLQSLRSRTNVRWHICVGGGGRSSGFAEMATQSATRQRFVDELLTFSRKHGLNGIDLDWEHPQTLQEVSAHGQLLGELRSRSREKELTISIAVAAWQTLSRPAIRAVDRVYLMAYNAGGPHATYARAVQDIERMIKRGVPAEKICLGIPFYGREIEGQRRTMTYAEIVRKHVPGPQVDQVEGYFFNGRKMVSEKVRLAQNRELRGVMIWEIGQDSPDPVQSLLRQIGRDIAP